MPVVSRALPVEDEGALGRTAEVLWVPFCSMEFSITAGGSLIRRRRRVSMDAYFSKYIANPANMLLMMRSFTSETVSYTVPSSHLVLHPKVSDPKELLMMAIRAYQELKKEYESALKQRPSPRVPRAGLASTFMESFARLFYGGKLADKLTGRRELVLEKPKHVEYKMVMGIMRDVLGRDIESPSVSPVIYFSTLVWRPYAIERIGGTLVFKDLTKRKSAVDKIYTGLLRLDEGFARALRELGLLDQPEGGTRRLA